MCTIVYTKYFSDNLRIMSLKKIEYRQQQEQIKEKLKSVLDVEEVADFVDVLQITVDPVYHMKQVNELNTIQREIYESIVQTIKHQMKEPCENDKNLCLYCKEDSIDSIRMFVTGEGIANP